MERIISILTIIILDILSNGKPAHGVNLNLNPIFVKDDVIPKTFEALFTRIQQEVPKESVKQKFVTKAYLSASNIPANSTKQIAKVMFQLKRKQVEDINEGKPVEKFINIPIVPQPFPDYKIIVATAPWNVRISGDDAKPAVIYIVFPEDDSNPNSLSIPAIYFVRKPDDEGHNLDWLLNKKDRIDPLIIVDSNRTVTGLKSNEVPKFINFKSRRYSDFKTML